MPSISFPTCSASSTVRVSSVHAKFCSFRVKNPDLSVYSLCFEKCVLQCFCLKKKKLFFGSFHIFGSQSSLNVFLSESFSGQLLEERKACFCSKAN